LIVAFLLLGLVESPVWVEPHGPWRDMMRAIVWLAGCTLLVAETYAQNPAPEPAHKTMLLTGCLQTGTSPSIFKLTNASSSAEAGRTAQPVTSRSATQGKLEFELTSAGAPLEVDAQKVDLKPHVGHWVEINARPPETAPPAVAPKPGDPSPAKAPTEDKPVERVIVVAIKHLAPACR
jgi:hypothetical protein